MGKLVNHGLFEHREAPPASEGLAIFAQNNAQSQNFLRCTIGK
jgi:hypothetical protein